MGDVTLREQVAAEKLRIAMIRRVESVICPRNLWNSPSISSKKMREIDATAHFLTFSPKGRAAPGLCLPALALPDASQALIITPLGQKVRRAS